MAKGHGNFYAAPVYALDLGKVENPLQQSVFWLAYLRETPMSRTLFCDW